MYFNHNYNIAPCGSNNQFSNFISANPPTTFNNISTYPTIDCSAFIGPFSSVIGDVTINQNVFIACSVTIRADEGSPFYIGRNTNLQDGVILHGVEHEYVKVNGKEYSIYIGDYVSCAHGSIVHGPCYVGNNTFVGVRAVIFNGYVDTGCYIGTGAIITNGAHIAKNRFVYPNSVIDTQDKADRLPFVNESDKEFARDVVAVNTEFSISYPLMFGNMHCSCGMCCKKGNIPMK